MRLLSMLLLNAAGGESRGLLFHEGPVVDRIPGKVVGLEELPEETTQVEVVGGCLKG